MTSGSKRDESQAPELIKTIRWLVNRNNWQGSWPFILAAAVILVVPMAWDYFAEKREHDRPLYLALRDDLKNLDRTVGNIAILRVIKDPKANADWVSYKIGLTEAAAKPVCEARQKISELGDKATRSDLDVICSGVETMRQLVSDNARGAVDLAVGLNHELIRNACEKVTSHVSGALSDCSTPR